MQRWEDKKGRRRSRKGVKERKRGKWTERGGREKREGRGEEEKWRGRRGREEERRSVLMSSECPKFRAYFLQVQRNVQLCVLISFRNKKNKVDITVAYKYLHYGRFDANCQDFFSFPPFN